MGAFTKVRFALALFAVALTVTDAFGDFPPFPTDATPGGATFSPTNPTTCDSLVTTYNATGTIITASDTAVSLFISFNNFLTTNIFAMSQISSTQWVFTNAIPATATNVTVYFGGTNNNFDSLDGDGWSVAVSSCSSGVVPVVFSPNPVTSCTGLNATYNPSGTVFATSAVMRLLIHYDTFPIITTNVMTLTTGGVWNVTVDIPGGPANAIISFEDENGDTDDNSGNFYTLALSVCTTGGGSGSNGVFGTRGDLNGDGLGDLVLKDEKSDTYFLFFMDGLQTIGGMDFLDTPTDISPFHLVAESDIDGDGTEDLIFQQGDSGIHVAAFMQGGEVVDAQYITFGGSSNISPWHVVAGGDLDGDGFGELIFQSSNSGVYAVAFMNGADAIASENLFGGTSTVDISPWRVVAAGDLDGDGNADLIFKFGDQNVYCIGFMDGSTMLSCQFFMNAFTDVSPWKLVAASDLDGDGFSELIFKFGDGDLYDVTTMDGATVIDSNYLLDGTNLAPWVVVGGN